MKRLIMCEGPNELTLINILLEHDALIFNEDDLLGLTAYHARQIKSSPQVRLSLLGPRDWRTGSATAIPTTKAAN